MSYKQFKKTTLLLGLSSLSLGEDFQLQQNQIKTETPCQFNDSGSSIPENCLERKNQISFLLYEKTSLSTAGISTDF